MPTARRSLPLYRGLTALLLVTPLACGEGPSAGPLGSSTSPVFASVAEKDLAIAFRLESAHLLRATDRTGAAELFPESWYQALLDAYRATSVGDALETENLREDWSLVSLRVSPCAPLGRTPAESVCWPEVRLVWQPITPEITVHARFSAAYADDRAVHALYNAPPELALPPPEAARVRRLLARVERDGDLLTAAERALIDGAQLEVARALVTRALALRGAGVGPGELSGHGIRPESLGSEADERALRDRTLDFLATFAPASQVKTLTSFSLPEGREPAHLDEWVFLSFSGRDGALARDDIRLFSRADGRALHDFGPSLTGSMTRDDPGLYSTQDGSADAQEIAGSVMLWTSDIERLTPSLRDRRETRVPNTSCVSCHKMNALRFDLHNFSYLEDRDLTVSPRVQTDVALDLAWVRANLR